MNVMENTEQRKIFLTSLALASAAGGLILFMWAAHISVPPCVFLRLTGLYCPGCGGTRACIALLHGQLLRSVYYHPVVVYGAAVYLAYATRNLLALLAIAAKRPGAFRGKFIRAAGAWLAKRPQGMAFRNGYLYGAIAIILLNWACKNLFHLPM